MQFIFVSLKNYFIYYFRSRTDKPFPAYEKLANIFGVDPASGKAAKTPTDVIEDIDQTENETTNVETEDEATPIAATNPPINKQSNQVPSSKKRKHNSSDNLGSCIERLAMSLESLMKKSSENVGALVQCLSAKEEDHQFIRDELNKNGSFY